MSDRRIIRIEPVPEFFSITWMLGSRCNYDCMYCPSELHDNTSKHHDLDTLKSLWCQIVEKSAGKNLRYKISFTGGEVTTNRDFLPFIQWIKHQHADAQIFVTSNGSASLTYYRRLCALIDGLSLSTHGEFIQETKFFSKASAINAVMTRPEKSLHVNIMDEVWNRDRIKIYEKHCQSHDIPYSINEISWNRKIRTEFFKQGTYDLDAD